MVRNNFVQHTLYEVIRTKAYVLNLTQAIYEELRRNNSNVHICALCPGPVNTEFNKTANVSFAIKGLNSFDVSKYAITQMFKKKNIIIPGIIMKLTIFATRFLPRKIVLRTTYNIQKQKKK